MTETIFATAKRTHRPIITWPIWICRYVCFLVLKFAFLVILYKLHLYDFGGKQTADPSKLHTTALGAHLAEFRRTARRKTKTTLKHMLRSRQLAEESEEDNLYWAPLRSTCAANINLVDPFPESFDPILYEQLFQEDVKHYLTYGKDRGYQCSRGQQLRDIMDREVMAVLPGSILEIGPFINPMIRSSKVKYFDIADWDGLVETADRLSYIVSPQPINIDYVDASGDLSIVDEQFTMVVSSNVIGVQNDIVRHLQSVAKLLVNGGYYTMLVPDKRFGAEHFLAETTIVDILEDFYQPKKSQTVRSIMENLALQSSVAAEQHWHGDHGELPYTDPLFLQNIREAIRISHEDNVTAPQIDVLRYHFTPQVLAMAIDTLFVLGLTDLRVHRLYETLADSGEFGIILKRCESSQAV